MGALHTRIQLKRTVEMSLRHLVVAKVTVHSAFQHLCRCARNNRGEPRELGFSAWQVLQLQAGRCRQEDGLPVARRNEQCPPELGEGIGGLASSGKYLPQ